MSFKANKTDHYSLFPIARPVTVCITNTHLGNPLEEKHSTEGDWRDQALKRLSKLKKLDGVPVVGQEEEEEEQ